MILLLSCNSCCFPSSPQAYLCLSVLRLFYGLRTAIRINMAVSLAKGDTETFSSKSDQGQDGRAGPIGLLHTLETSLDDIRTLITCRVCVRPLFEPYTIECGHTFCYGCLVRWFERDRTKKSCPDCRANVLRSPAPAYLVRLDPQTARKLLLTFVQVRDMTQIFANRAELMPVGETIQDHKKWQEEEAALVEKDKETRGHKGGLFRGCFRRTRRRLLPAIRDDEDGVDRCPTCTWELEDGLCGRCGYRAGEDSNEMSDSDGHGHWDDDLYDMDGATMEDLMGALGENPHMGTYMPNPDFLDHGYSSEEGSFEGTPPRMRQRDRQITAHLNRLRAHSEEDPPYDSFLDDTDEGSEDEEVGSLDGFVVNDVENSPHSVSSSIRWETDEGTDEEGNQPPNSDNDQNSQYEDGSPRDRTQITNAQQDTEDEFDEGPILRSRRQVRERSLVSSQSTRSDDSSGSGVSQALNALRGRNEYDRSRLSANAQLSIAHRNPDASGERYTLGPIDTGSDSDSPVPVQHSRRRRVVPLRFSSDDESDDVEVSSGTATVGRDSPRPSQDSNASSPMLIQSSPTRSTNSVPGAFPQRPPSAMSSTSPHPENARQIGRRAPTRANHGANYSPRAISIRRSTTSASPSSGLQQRRGTRRRSPLPTRAHLHSPTSRQSHSPTAMEIFEQGRRDRQTQKIERRAERRRLKAEREQRVPRSGLSPSPGASNQYEEL